MPESWGVFGHRMVRKEGRGGGGGGWVMGREQGGKEEGVSGHAQDRRL